MDDKSLGRGLKRYFTILDWLPNYRSEWLRFDIIAALSVWALLVPQGIAYSSIAGVPAQYGLYAALGALLGYALFGTSGQVVSRMMVSPFTFYRGVAAVMASDLSCTPATGLTLVADGDCHRLNFGGFATAERNVIFDINDFDEGAFSP